MVSQRSSPTYEHETQAIARQLLATMQGHQTLWKKLKAQTQWDDKLLTWAMDSPGLRVQLFRLIDCLPSLTSKTEIARHLQAYLGIPSVELPAALKQILNFAQPDSLPGQLATTTFTTAVGALSHRFIAGETLPQALKTIERLRHHGMTFTLDMLGEAVITEPEAQHYLQGYLDLMGQLATAASSWPTVPQIDQAEGEALPKVQVSVKLTAFYSQFDPLDDQGSQKRVSDRLRVLLRHAHELGVAVHFDMEQYRYKALTLTILKDLLMEPEFRDRTDIGLTLQAYLRDSYRDLDDLIDWSRQRGTPLTLRLVKGAYWDQETITAIQKEWPQPVYNQKFETDANFERMTQLLLHNHDLLYAAIGSHNPRSQAKAIAVAQALEIPPRRFELQVLYGMADKLAHALVDQGHRVRVYCPYGQLIPGMAYLIRRLLENTANTSFLRQSLGGTSGEQWVMAPEMHSEYALRPGSDNGISPANNLKVRHTVDSSTADQRTFTNAPDTDYAKATARKQAQKALEQVRAQLGQTYWPLINGEQYTQCPTQPSLNPSNPEEIVGQVGQVSLEQAEEAIQAAVAAFPAWRRTPVKQRADILRRAADLMEQRRQELAYWMVLEVGKVLREADAEVSEAIDFCRYYATEMERLDQGCDRDLPGETNHYHYQPRGIAGVISPWNFPLAIPTGMTVAALVAGNCTLLKPAGPAAVIAAKLSEILVEAGIPDGVFQYLPGSGAVLGPFLTRHPAVHLIAFTGSQAVGCQIYAEAAVLQPGQTHLKRVIAEMGGKNAIIIDHSADLDQAIAGVLQSAFSYSGQKCSACSRVIVLEKIYDRVVQRLVEATRSLKVGAAEDLGTTVGPVISTEARHRILDFISQGKAEATVALETSPPESGYFVGPVILTDVAPQAAIAQTEIFGPVLTVLPAPTFEAAIAIANGTQYALTGGLYSRTPTHIDQAKAEFAVGNLYINRGITGAIVDRQPFGGFKLSGLGTKAGGHDYLLQFLEPRVITENIQRQGFAPL